MSLTHQQMMRYVQTYDEEDDIGMIPRGSETWKAHLGLLLTIKLKSLRRTTYPERPLQRGCARCGQEGHPARKCINQPREERPFCEECLHFTDGRCPGPHGRFRLAMRYRCMVCAKPTTQAYYCNQGHGSLGSQLSELTWIGWLTEDDRMRRVYDLDRIGPSDPKTSNLQP